MGRLVANLTPELQVSDGARTFCASGCRRLVHHELHPAIPLAALLGSVGRDRHTEPARAAPWVDGQGDRAVRTVVVTLPDAAFSNALDHEADFRIHCEGPNDVQVRWVRVVRHALPDAPQP